GNRKLATPKRTFFCNFSPPEPYLCRKFQNGMGLKMAKSLLVAVFSLFSTLIFAQGQGSPGAEPKKKFDANEVIFGHIKDAHEFHFFSYKDKEGEVHHATISLPVILYSPAKGWSFFMSSKFHHGEENYNGYKLLTVEKLEEMAKEDPKEAKKFHQGQIVAVNENGE